jgi:hypothetical protein
LVRKDLRRGKRKAARVGEQDGAGLWSSPCWDLVEVGVGHPARGQVIWGG